MIGFLGGQETGMAKGDLCIIISRTIRSSLSNIDKLQNCLCDWDVHRLLNSNVSRDEYGI